MSGTFTCTIAMARLTTSRVERAKSTWKASKVNFLISASLWPWRLNVPTMERRGHCGAVTGSNASSATQRDRLSRTPTVNSLLRFAPSRVLYMTMILGAVILGDSMIYNVLPTGVDSFGVSVALVAHPY